MKIIKDISYAEYDECQLDIYLPDNDLFSVFVYFHGGGLESGDKIEANVLAKYLVKHNIAVVSANYRMYPSAKFPEYVEDAAKCVSWTIENINNYGSCKDIYIGGSSAGGYISMLLCFDKKYLSQYKIMSTDITGYIHNAGQPTAHFNVLREKGIDTRRVIVDETAPLYHIDSEGDYSKMIFIVSDNDMENRLEQIMLTQSTLKHFGYDVDVKVIHGCHCEYVEKENDKGESILGKIIYSYIDMWKKDDYEIKH